MLKHHYMEGESLSDIYDEDVYIPRSNSFRNFNFDMKVLAENLAPYIFGIKGLKFLSTK